MHHPDDDFEYPMQPITEVVDDRPEVIEALPDEETILAFTHHHRAKLVRKMVEKGIPDDKGDKLVLLSALKDMDMGALTRKKIKADGRNAEMQAQNTKAIIAELLMATPNHAKVGNAIGVTAPKKLGADVPPPKLVEGETATVAPHQTYDTFVAKFPRPGLDA